VTPEGGRWWESTVFYQIYPRSFCDRSGDGVGDLEGIRARLDHVAGLGVGAIWLSPVYRSPMADFGYDVSDYCDIDPLFGDLAALDSLIGAAHERDLKVVLDWVPNHTSDRHPWFVESRSGRDNPRRDWYIWRDGSPDRPPNDWRAAFKGVGGRDFPSAWTWDELTGQWYLHLFLAEQPDLNWANPAVREAMAGVIRFWLDRGVDGFRVDVVHALAKPPGLPDLPADQAGIPYCAFIDDPGVHPIVAGIRKVIDAAPPPRRVLIGEIVLPTVAQNVPYYGQPDRPELHLGFNFHPLRARWDAPSWRRQIDAVTESHDPAGAWPTWVLSNHDNPRHRTRYGTEARARAAAVLLLTLRGTPFLYAGEELGLSDADIPPECRVDPGGRDGCRAPIPWDAGPGHGWAGDPWLPWPPEAAGASAAEQDAAGPGSTLGLYRQLLAARNGSPALRSGGFDWLESGPGTIAYSRRAGEDVRAIAVNFETGPGWATLPAGDWTVRLTSIPGGGTGSVHGRFDLRPDEAVILTPRQGTAGPT
jgi:alpha-glucosidase